MSDGQKSLFVHAAAQESRAAAPSLRDRAAAVYRKLQTDSILGQGDPVQTLFVTAEDRAEFVALVREAKPNMAARPIP